MEQSTPTLETLKRLRPLAEFSDAQLLALAQKLTLQSANNKEEILNLGNVEESSLFILEGEVSMISSDDHHSVHTASSDEMINPIAQLRPSMYSVQAIKTIHYLKIPKKLIIQFSNYGQENNNNDLEVLENNPAIEEITLQICQDMLGDQLSLPSLPEMALKIQRVYQDDLADINTIANLIISDPAITAKLIKIANSVVYQGEVPTNTLKAAISRLGLDTTYKQVMSYAVNDLFKSSSKNIKQKMTELWDHSRKVAAISHLLAQETKLFNPELAMLAGLVHDLGTIVILEYLEHADIAQQEHLDSELVVNTLRPIITGMLMKKWNFTEETITVAEECEDWFRNENNEPDLCDLVMLAQYHSFIGTDAIKKLPPITSIPAMKKLGLSPVDSIALMKNSKDKIKAMEALLN